MYGKSSAAAALLLIATAVHAQIIDGTFDLQGTYWSVSAPPGWSVAFPTTGGDPGGYASIESPPTGSGGRACISQRFECGSSGETGTCYVGFRFRFHYVSGVGGDFLVHMPVLVDGQDNFGLPYISIFEPWSYAQVPAGSCGTHTVSFCLDLSPGNFRYAIGIDNVQAIDNCATVGTEKALWSHVKSLYH